MGPNGHGVDGDPLLFQAAEKEYQTEKGEALRDDARFAHVAAWEYTGEGKKPIRNVEQLEFEYVPLQTRSYK